LDAQVEAFSKSDARAREIAYFKENIGAVNSVDDLMSDRRLLSFSLGAFGLADDIGNTYFVNKLLADGTLSEDALANRLSDQRYFEFSKAFGFGDFSVPNTQLSDFAQRISDKYLSQSFQAEVGAQNQNMRLALNVEDALGEIIESRSSEDARWFAMMGDPPLRRVVQSALGFPDSFASIDLDTQLSKFKERSEQVFGAPGFASLADQDVQEKMIRLFMVRAEAASSTANIAGAQTALTLLSGNA